MFFLYISKPPDKAYDFDMMLNYCALAVGEIGWDIDEIYADGWVSIPNGIDDLIADIGVSKKIKGVCIYSLEEITEEQLKTLAKIAPLYCALTPWVNPVKNAKPFIDVKKSKEYYSKLTSLRIRQGVKASGKRSGAAPFGYQHDDTGKLTPNADYNTLCSILNLDNAGMSVSEIAKRESMSPAKIYGILKTAKGREAQ